MDEFEYKFSRKDPILVINTVKTLVEKIRGFYLENNKIEYEKYYKYLRGKCLQSDIAISTTAADGILSLCEGGEKGEPVLKIEVLLNDLITSLQLQNCSTVINLIFHAMDKIDFSKYGIMFNQHPLITIMKRDEQAWPLILTNINNSLDSSTKVKLQYKLQPLILYSLYDYEGKVNEMFQHKLLKLYKESSNEILLHKIMLFNKQHLVRTARYCRSISKTNRSVLPTIIIVIHELIKHNMDASEGLLILKQATKILENADVSIELCLLVDCIQIAPLMHLTDILEICVHLLTCTYSNRTLYMLKSSLLKCKLNLSTYNRQTEKLMGYINKIMITEFPNNVISDPSRNHVIIDVNTFISAEILKDSLLENINQLEACPITLLKKLFSYFLSVLYESTDEELIGIVLPTLVRCSESDPIKTSQLLSVVLYKLACCYIPNINLSLIKILPKLAVLKENLPVILTTIKTFSVYSPKMQTLALFLLYEIFCLDIRCFSYLQELLIKENKSHIEEIMNYENSKAYVLKELCRKNVHLEVYGSEFAGYISKILNSSRDGNNCLAQALALEGLKYLCKNDIIDVGSAWDNLSVHYEHDSRGDVVKSLCEMLTELAHEPSPDVKHEQLVLNVIERLWSYTMNDDLLIVKAAYNALGYFTLEQVSVGFPVQYAVGTCNAFGNIPGASWVNLLLKCRKEELKIASDFLRTLIVSEVKNFKNSIYTVVDGGGEPETFELPGYSVLGAVFDYVKSKVTKWKTMNSDVYLQCLRILSFKYSKPLPPVDWCFLQELIHEKAARECCIKIAAHQVILSGTARRLIENFILALTDDTELNTDTLTIYKCFVYLSNSIQPMIVKPFVAKTLDLAITKFQSGFEEDLFSILECIKHVLEENTVSGVNKVVIGEEIVNRLHVLDYTSKVFDTLISCVHAIPLEKLNDVSSPFQFVTMNPQILEKCLKIRCTAAVNTTVNPFIYLDVFIDGPIIKIDLNSNTSRDLSFRILYDWLRLVFQKHSNHTKSVPWLIELMAKIQLELADNQDFQTVLFESSVFIIAICVLSGMDIFRSNFQSFKEYSACFPYALCTILKLEKWTTYSSQVLEWLYDVSTNRTYKRPPESEHIVSIFKMGLLTSRNEDAFNEKLKWMKFIEIDV